MNLIMKIHRSRSPWRTRPRLTTLVTMAGLGVLLSTAVSLHAQGPFQVVTSKAFDSAVPKDFYLEGNAIPVEKRNSVLLSTQSGARVLFGLIDTTGYSSQIQKKYIGMMIAETPIAACSVDVPVGSYGFGLQKPASQGQGSGEFFVYDQAGKQVGSCAVEADKGLKQPRPLQVTTGSDGNSMLCLGRYCIALRSKE